MTKNVIEQAIDDIIMHESIYGIKSTTDNNHTAFTLCCRGNYVYLIILETEEDELSDEERKILMSVRKHLGLAAQVTRDTLKDIYKALQYLQGPMKKYAADRIFKEQERDWNIWEERLRKFLHKHADTRDEEKSKKVLLNFLCCKELPICTLDTLKGVINDRLFEMSPDEIHDMYKEEWV